VSARTAGFNSVPIGAMPLASLFVLIVLMFIGGSPGSYAGGIKTTTLAVWWARFRATFNGDFRAVLGNRYIPEEIGRKVTMLIGLALTWNLVGVLVLTWTERAPMDQLLFEQVSAFGTVGLSMGLTPELSTAGKLWIILTMFVGRVGPITIAMSSVRMSRGSVQYAEGRVMIG
jgi:trk system potassium uptake protein TrkH